MIKHTSIFIFTSLLITLPALAVDISSVLSSFDTQSLTLEGIGTNQNTGTHYAPPVENDCDADELASLNAVAGTYERVGHGDDSEHCIPTKCKSGYALVHDAGDEGDTTACIEMKQIDPSALDAETDDIMASLDRQIEKNQKQIDKTQTKKAREVTKKLEQADQASLTATAHALESERCSKAGGKYENNKCNCPKGGCKCESGQKWNNNDVVCENTNARDNCIDAGGKYESNKCICPESGCTCAADQEWDNDKIKCVKKKTAPAEQAPVNTAASKNTQTQKPHSEEEIKDLQAKVDAAKAKEQSFANRMLSGATMAATGAGGQMLASALSEQKADEQAEQDMNAYLATFRCNYGPHRVQGGEQNVQIPGGNELINLYQQYVTLANDLKVRKNALGMRAGIESEPILDNATSGLYDDVGTGITSGAYASLARALMNPGGEDAAKWAAQKEETQKQLKTGAITAGVGAVVGIAGNVLINHVDWNKKKRKDDPAVKAKYKKVTDATNSLEQKINSTPITKECDTSLPGVTGGKYPDCTCKKETERFFDGKGCIACEKGKHYNDNKECVPDESKCKLTGKVSSSECKCVENATHDTNNRCSCIDGYEDKEGNNICTKKDPAEQAIEKSASDKTVVIDIKMSGDVLFHTSSSKLTPSAKKYLQEFAQLIQQHENLFTPEMFNTNKVTMIIYGNTDRVPFQRGDTSNNTILSQERAQSVKNELIQHNIFASVKDKIHTIGNGAAECTKELHPKRDDPECRSVRIEISVASDNSNASTLEGLKTSISNLSSK